MLSSSERDEGETATTAPESKYSVVDRTKVFRPPDEPKSTATGSSIQFEKAVRIKNGVMSDKKSVKIVIDTVRARERSRIKRLNKQLSRS